MPRQDSGHPVSGHEGLADVSTPSLLPHAVVAATPEAAPPAAAHEQLGDQRSHQPTGSVPEYDQYQSKHDYKIPAIAQITSAPGQASPPSVTKLLLLYLYSGPSEGESSFRAIAEQDGHQVECHDTAAVPPTDLASDAEWAIIEGKLKAGAYDGGLASPPCRTFSKARSHGSARKGRKHRLLRPLRTADGPERYGRKDLRPEEIKKARLDTLLAVRAAVAANILIDQNKPMIIETPRRSRANQACSRWMSTLHCNRGQA